MRTENVQLPNSQLAVAMALLLRDIGRLEIERKRALRQLRESSTNFHEAVYIRRRTTFSSPDEKLVGFVGKSYGK